MLKTAPQGLPRQDRRIPEILSPGTLKMVTPGPVIPPATTTTLLVATLARPLLITQEWAVLPDKDIPRLTPRHSAHQGMKDMEEVLQELRDITITQDKVVLRHLGVDSTTKTQVLQRLEMICTTEGGAGVGTRLDLGTHKEVHQPHRQELLHHPTIHQPPNLLINIRKVEMGHSQGVLPGQGLRARRVGCRLRALG